MTVFDLSALVTPRDQSWPSNRERCLPRIDVEVMSTIGDDDFAIVIPAYNAARYLADTLRSALSAGSWLAEIVVVDDGSTDATAAIAREFEMGSPRVHLIRRANGGVARARNTGLERVEAAYVCFLDADDVLRPGALDILRDALRSRADAVAAFGRVAYLDRESNSVPPSTRPNRAPPSIGLSDVLSSNFIDTPGAVLFRTEAVREAGGFVPGLAMAEDWEMYVRVASRGAFLANVATVLDYRVHPVSAMHRDSLCLQDFEPALQRVFDDPNRYAGRIDAHTLRRYELRNRAGVLRVLCRSSTTLTKSLRLLLDFGRLAVQARFDRMVVALCVRSAVHVGTRALGNAARLGPSGVS